MTTLEYVSHMTENQWAGGGHLCFPATSVQEVPSPKGTTKDGQNQAGLPESGSKPQKPQESKAVFCLPDGVHGVTQNRHSRC